jgi:hypothetical protein
MVIIKFLENSKKKKKKKGGREELSIGNMKSAN